MSDKVNRGNFFEEFRVGQEINHATPRTVTAGDAALGLALFGSRFVVNSSAEIAKELGLRETSNGEAGVVYVRTVGVNQRDKMVVSDVRWVLVKKRNHAAPAPQATVPEIPESVAAEALILPEALDLSSYDCECAGSPHLWEDYETGERIDHLDGYTVEEAEHMMMTRLTQNNAPIHFNAQLTRDHRFGRRVVTGGHVISLARAISFNGLANAFRPNQFRHGARIVTPRRSVGVYRF